MTNFQPAPQIIEEFREREGESFVYGFGKTQPRCPFLFEVNSESRLFRINQNDEFLDGPLDNFYIDDLSSEYNYANCLPFFFYSATEAHVKRISVKKYKCTICGYESTRSNVIDHIISQHSDKIRTFLEPHLPYINKDDKPFSGLFTKCQFEALITPPSKPYQMNRGQGGNICAPIITDHDEYDECESQNEKSDTESTVGQKYIDPLTQPEQYRVHYEDGFIAPLTKFARDHRPMPIESEEEDGNEENAKLESITEDFDRKEIILESVNAFYMPVSEQQQSLLLQQKLQQKQETQEKQQAATVQATPKKQQQNAVNKQIEDTMKALELAEKKSEIEEKMKKEAKEPPKPKYIPYINTIPTNIIDDVLKIIADKFIGDYVEPNTLVISKQQLTAAKKAHSKKMKDEKLARQKAKEKKRIEEMKERRAETIKKVTQQIATPLLRSFVRQEINEIFGEEMKAAAKAKEVPKCKATSGGLLSPVVVTGLTSPKHLSLHFLYELFSNLNFVYEDKKPMIRFRVRNQMYEVLLFLANEQEIMKAEAMSPLQVGMSTAEIKMDKEVTLDGTWLTCTGQKIIEFTLSKNMEGIHKNGGLLLLEQMSPMCDIGVNKV